MYDWQEKVRRDVEDFEKSRNSARSPVVVFLQAVGVTILATIVFLGLVVLTCLGVKLHFDAAHGLFGDHP